ncbi:MAG: dihydrofolate reductase, partial [bacterium]
MATNRVIGDRGKIPWHLPEDLRWFKELTMGGTLLMGRVTYDSIGKPLPGRVTIVMSRRDGLVIPGVQVIRDLSGLQNAETQG